MAGPGTELDQAYAAFSKGLFDESSRLCSLVLARDAREPRALRLAAAISLNRGDAALALEQISAAIAVRPGDALQHHTRGLALRSLGRAVEAEADFREALRLAADMPDSHASLGFIALERGESGSAQRHFQEALRLGSQSPDVHTALGGIFAQRGEPGNAVREFEAAIRIDPRNAHAWNNLGVVRTAQWSLDEAARCFEQAIAAAPADPNAWINLGNALRRAKRPRDAERAYREAIARAPAAAIAWTNLGNLLKEQGRFPEALECLEKAVSISGQPAAHMSLAILLLQTGDLERGWNEYRWRHGREPSREARPSLESVIASGGPVELRGEQGLGDALFFLRWAPRLGVPLRWRGDTRLRPLLRTCGQLDIVDEPQDPLPGPNSVAIGDLPALLGRNGNDYPPPLPLKADADALEAARSFLRRHGPPPYVAVAWRAGMPAGGAEEALSKNAPLEAIGACLRPLAATVVCVQRDPRPGETQAFEQALGRAVAQASECNNDLMRAVAMLAAMDRYVGVSSTNVHIAAGLGTPASILVPAPGEWRYGVEGDATPWFPGYRLYREHNSRGWDRAFETLGADLARHLAIP